MKGLSENDKKLIGALNRGVDAADSNPLTLDAAAGNKPFTAQFDVTVLVKYFTEVSDVYTSVAASAIASTLKTKLAAFLFGQSDYAAGFKKSIQQFPVTVWAYGQPFTYGKDVATCALGPLDATVTAQLEIGDIVIPFTATTAGPINTLGLVILRSPQVGYAKLVDSLSSDRFWINNVRYVLTDTSAAGLTQYDNEVKVQKQSLFGLFNENSVSPTAFKEPTQFQAGIVDMLVNQGIDKNVIVGSYINYDSITQKFTIFVQNFDRLKA
jgi:hypothetical protein